MHDDLLERMALHVAQEHLLDLAVDVQVQDRRIEPFVLLGQPDLLVVELDGLRRGLAAVDDGRDRSGMAQAAARTLPLDIAARGLDVVFGHLVTRFHCNGTASRR